MRTEAMQRLKCYRINWGWYGPSYMTAHRYMKDNPKPLKWNLQNLISIL